VELVLRKHFLLSLLKSIPDQKLIMIIFFWGGKTLLPLNHKLMEGAEDHFNAPIMTGVPSVWKWLASSLPLVANSDP